jgi:hypothetical protein
MSRHFLFYDFLVEYRTEFDRILIVDVTDTIFQQDPFTTDFGYYTVGITSEVTTLNADPLNNTKWIQLADPDYKKDPTFYESRVVLNSGLVFGSMEGILIYYSILFRQPFYQRFRPATVDQGYVNFMFYRKVFESGGLNLQVTYPGDYLVSARGVKFENRTNAKGLFQVAGQSGIPGAIHQYNRICPLMIQMEEFCPALAWDTRPYAKVKDVSQPCA